MQLSSSPGLEVKLSQRAIAAALGLSESAVSKLRRQGMPITSIEAARTWREVTLDPARRRQAPDQIRELLPAQAMERAPFDQEQKTNPAAEGSDTSAYQASRAMREAAQAQMAQIELQKQLGQLGSILDFQRAVTAMAQLVQDRVLQLPSRMSSVLAAETDPVKIEALLTHEIKDSLDGIAQRAAELARPAGRTG